MSLESNLTEGDAMEAFKELCESELETTEIVDWPLWVVSGPASLLLASLSTYGNIISLRILSSLRIRKSVRFYLSILAIINAAISQCSLWYYAVSETLLPIFGKLEFFSALTVILHPVSAFTLTMSVWMVLTVTVDRYLALAKPLQHRAYDSRRRAQLITLCQAILAIIFTIPSSFELRLTRDCDQFLPIGQSKLVMLPTELRLSQEYLLFYSIMANSLLLTLGPLVLITILSSRMLCVVYTARALRNTLDASNDHGRSKMSAENTTLMLLTVVVKFLVCNSPSMLLNLWEKLGGSIEISSTQLFRWCVELSNLLVTINSASDSIVYLRWKRKQTAASSQQYTAVPKSMFTVDESNHLKLKFNSLVEKGKDAEDHPLLGLDIWKEFPIDSASIQITLSVMVESIGDAAAEVRMISTLNDMGARYCGVTISPAIWNRFKNEFVAKFSSDSDSQLWSRLVCILIREFRKGQQMTAEKRSSNRYD